MQWQTGIAIAIAPTLGWLAHKAMLPLVRRIRRMRNGKLKRLLLVGDDGK